MKNIFILFIFVWLGLTPSSFSADFEKGLDAYDKGDYANAIKEWRPLAEQGDADAQYNLGRIYQRGDGVLQNYKEAVKWYRLAVEQGNELAAFNLGIMYEGSMYDGKLINYDFEEAMKLYLMSAKQGYMPAFVNIGRMYSLGKGVAIDHKESIRWYRIAAENGSSDAKYNIGAKYINGTGVKINYSIALMWMNLAMRHNNFSSDRVYEMARVTREKVISVMTTGDIALASKLEQKCVSNNYKGC